MQLLLMPAACLPGGTSVRPAGPPGAHLVDGIIQLIIIDSSR